MPIWHKAGIAAASLLYFFDIFAGAARIHCDRYPIGEYVPCAEQQDNRRIFFFWKGVLCSQKEKRLLALAPV